MPDKAGIDLGPVTETLLIPLYARAIESMRSDALIRDERAVALAARVGSLLPRFKHVAMDSKEQLSIVLRAREFDTCVRDFLTRHADAVVVHAGCGLDTRFDRVDNGQVEWFDLDVPEVIELRRRLIGEEERRYHLLACSVFDQAWMQEVTALPRPVLLVAEGVLIYSEEARTRALVKALRSRFPGSELVCDVFTPLQARLHNLRIGLSRGRVGARYLWKVRRATDVEQWGSDIRLLHQWYLYDRPEPRLPGASVVRLAPFLARGWSLAHYRLGDLPA